MKDLPLEKSGGKIDLLLGIDHNSLIVARESRFSSDAEPTASKTVFGWIARGRAGNEDGNRLDQGVFARSVYDRRLDEVFERFYNDEAYGSELKATPRHNPEIQRAIDQVAETKKKLLVGYQVSLVWAVGEPRDDGGESRRIVERRFRFWLQRFLRDPSYENKYRAAMQAYFDEGYTDVVDDGDLVGCQTFLPHHGVFKSNDPHGKLRIVFDAAAKGHGRSLNDALLAGPALQAPLADVLLRFREGELAVTADITSMFSRVRLEPSDARHHM